MKTSRFNGRCPGCKKPVSVVVHGRRDLSKDPLQDPYTRTEDGRRLFRHLAGQPLSSRPLGPPTQVLRRHVVAETQLGSVLQSVGRDHVVRMMCPRGCDEWLTLQPVVGVYKPDVPSNANCTSAAGPKCECSCAGDNHGADHSKPS